jgi:membrane fusion protein (multidrug efflux system)
MNKPEIIAEDVTAAKIQPTAKTKLRYKVWFRSAMMMTPLLVLALIIAYFYGIGGRSVVTENAYVKAVKIQISPQVSGTINRLNVHDNQQVKTGDILLELDAAGYEATTERAAAALDEARGQIRAAKSNYWQREAELKLAQSKLDFANAELGRRQKLAKRKLVSQESLEQYAQDVKTQKLKIQIKQQEITSILSLLGSPEIEVDHHPRVRGMLAALDAAQLNVQYAKIIAPSDGIVTQAPELGEFVRAGMPLLAIVSDAPYWVEANFKETSLTHVRVGQRVELELDIFPGKTWQGNVRSIDPATGAEFSILPSQNATGNWVKVVQRLTLQASIDDPDPDMPLRAGMSVKVRVFTDHRRKLPGILAVPLRWFGADVDG